MHATARPFKGEIEAKRTRYIVECEKKRPPLPNLPTGTVTFLFTDIEGSTTRWEQYPEAMRAALARQDALLRSVILAHGGFVRSWKMDSPNVLLLIHGLGAHSGWFIDVGTQVASYGISVYAMDHRGFGRSGGIRAHIDDYHTYVEDIGFVLTEIRKRHPEAGIFVLGHSMGGIFTAYTVAKYQDMLAGALFLNPWVRDSRRIPLGTSLEILLGGLFKSKRYWQVAGGTETMTTNPEAIQMLQEDYFWQRRQTSSFLFQIGQMRSAIMKQARQITIPARVMQGENDKSVIHEATHELYEALASSDKTWKTYPGYDHDSEMQDDRSQLDNDLVAWIREHSSSTSRA